MAGNNSIELSSPDTEQQQDSADAMKFWLSQLQASKEATKEYWRNADEAWREYLGTYKDGPASVKIPASYFTPDTRYPIYWASIRTMQPALYSRTPQINVQKVFDNLQDDIARVATLALERLGKYLMRCCPFDRVMYAARDTFLQTGRATARVYLDAYIKQTTTKHFVTQVQVPDPNAAQQQVDPQTQQPMPPAPPAMIAQWQDSDGNPPEGSNILEQDGRYYYESLEEDIDSIKSILLPLGHIDVLHTPNARHYEEIDWIAYRALMTKQEVAQRFSKEVANKINYEAFTQTYEGSDKKEVKLTLPTSYACIWEVWDKRDKKVRWIADGYTEAFLDEKPDPYELDGFFPSAPFILGTIGPDNLYPVPDYVQLRPFINQLHGMAHRLRKLIRAARRRGLADASIPELAQLANEADEAEFVLVNAFQQQVVGKGGIENIVKFFPTEEFVSAINEMISVIQNYENKFNELYGIPDILRGVTDPNETAAAQQLKGRYLSLRFSSIQREFQRFVRDSIERMCDLALRKFPEDRLADICGASHMPPEDQAVWPQAMLLLRDDTERKVRLDIETDSTITMNQNADIEQRNYLAKTLFEGLAGVANASSQNPAFAAAAGAVLMYVIDGLREGKQIEGKLRPAVEALSQPQPEKPDPAAQKAQMDAQLTQLKGQQQMQLEQQKTQGKAQIEQVQAQADIATTQAKASADIQTEAIKTRAKMAHDERFALLEASLETLKAQLAAALKLRDHEVKTDAEQQRTNRMQLKDAFKAPPPGS